MYNYNNTQKNSASKHKKLNGPNADRVNHFMSPGAYNVPRNPGVPDWIAAASRPTLHTFGAPPAPPAGNNQWTPSTPNPSQLLSSATSGLSSTSRGASSSYPYPPAPAMSQQEMAQQQQLAQMMQGLNHPAPIAPTPGKTPAQIAGVVGASAYDALPHIYNSAVGALTRPRGSFDQQVTNAFAPSLAERAYDGVVQGQANRNRDAVSNMSYEQLMAAQGVQPRMSPEEIQQMEAETNARIAQADALHNKSMEERAAIEAGYAPRTESLRRSADSLSARNDRAESALRGELGPRAPQADPSGPYYRDPYGQPYNNRVDSSYSISEAEKDRHQKIRDETNAAGEAYKIQREAQRDALRNRKEKPIEDPEQLARDAAQFSTEYNLYRKGGGRLSAKEYIIQRAATEPFSEDLTKQLEYNYKIDLSPGKLASVDKSVDITSQRGKAMDDAAQKRSEAQQRRQDLSERNRQIIADRNAGFYNTAPEREEERLENVNDQIEREYEATKQAEQQAHEKEMLQQKAKADEDAFQRQLDIEAQDEYNAWANATRADIKAQGYRGDPIAEPNSPAGIEWQRRQMGYTGRRPRGMGQQDPAGQPPQTPPNQPPQAPPSQPPQAPPSQPPQTPPADPGASAKDQFAQLEHDIVNDERFRIDPNASPLEHARAIANEAAKRGLPARGVSGFIKEQPGGLNLSDHETASTTLNDIVKEMNDYGHKLVGEMPGGLTEGNVADKFSQGRTAILNKYSSILNILKSTLGEQAVNEAIDRNTQWDEWLYTNTGNPSAGPLGIFGPMVRGMFGG